MIDFDRVISLAERRGADYVGVRCQDVTYELIVVDNGVLREYSVSERRGVGLRVVVDGCLGFAATNDVSDRSVGGLVDRAVSIARAMKLAGRRVALYERKACRGRVSSEFKVDPLDVAPEEKISVVMDAYKSGSEVEDVISVSARLGVEHEHRAFYSNLGDQVEVTVKLIGLAVTSIARYGGVMERVGDSESMVAGWEFIDGEDWNSFAREVSELASRAVRAPAIKPGEYVAVLDNDIIGIMLHEAFGHATEGDIVEARGSVLRGRIGEQVASPLVTIIDEGVVQGGYYVPYDDEGTPKRRVATVEKGILRTFLHSLSTAKSLNSEPTGNARAMDYSHPILVRQTNTFMEPGDHKVEELFEGVQRGVYIRGRGALGGQVNSTVGSFTFTAGPSYLIEKGELKGLVRGVMLSGNILETLKSVDAVANDLKIRTNVFGGCGKMGQRVRTGLGGPHTRVRKITISSGR